MIDTIKALTGVVAPGVITSLKVDIKDDYLLKINVASCTPQDLDRLQTYLLRCGWTEPNLVWSHGTGELWLSK